MKLFALDAQVDLVVDVAFICQNVLEREGVAVLVCVDGIAHEDVLRKFAPAAEVHEDFIFNAPARIGSEFGALFAVEGGNGLNEPDGPDGDEIVLILEAGVILL